MRFGSSSSAGPCEAATTCAMTSPRIPPTRSAFAIARASSERSPPRGSRFGTEAGAEVLKTYQGSCHCGAVRFEADLDLTQATYRCNCSICRRTRFWPAVAREGGFRLLSGESELTQYLFNSRRNQHYFCKHCGVRAFGVGTETPIGKMYGVNLGCLECIGEEELARLPITYVDGRSDRWQSSPEFFAHLYRRGRHMPINKSAPTDDK